MANRLYNLLFYTIGPSFLIITSPITIILLSHCVCKLDASLVSLWVQIQEKGVLSLISEIWLSQFFGTELGWRIVCGFSVFQLLLMRILSGPQYSGPRDSTGYEPQYVDNGLFAYIVTCCLFFVLSSYGCNLFSASIFIDYYQEITVTLVCFGFLICSLLYIKGLVWPCPSQHGSSGNPIFDFYSGLELYPRVLGWDVKMFTNCRFGMMLWQMLIFSALAKQHLQYGVIQDSLWVTAIIQTQYIFKFFAWEKGYMKCMDIAHDCAGFYICWGCIAYIFVMFNTPTLYLAFNRIELGMGLSWILVLVGTFCIWLTYWVDMQKEIFRETKGECLVFGTAPQYMEVKYSLEDGRQIKSLFLVSGFWGWSRQFHCVPEYLVMVSWALPSLMINIYPYLLVIIMVLIMIQHVIRDEWKCQLKYGKYWNHYCKRVPYRVIPYVI